MVYILLRNFKIIFIFIATVLYLSLIMIESRIYQSDQSNIRVSMNRKFINDEEYSFQKRKSRLIPTIIIHQYFILHIRFVSITFISYKTLIQFQSPDNEKNHQKTTNTIHFVNDLFSHS